VTRVCRRAASTTQKGAQHSERIVYIKRYSATNVDVLMDRTGRSTMASCFAKMDGNGVDRVHPRPPRVERLGRPLSNGVMTFGKTRRTAGTGVEQRPLHGAHNRSPLIQEIDMETSSAIVGRFFVWHMRNWPEPKRSGRPRFDRRARESLICSRGTEAGRIPVSVSASPTM
jgi:hypothetical protein